MGDGETGRSLCEGGGGEGIGGDKMRQDIGEGEEKGRGGGIESLREKKGTERVKDKECKSLEDISKNYMRK